VCQRPLVYAAFWKGYAVEGVRVDLRARLLNVLRVLDHLVAVSRYNHHEDSEIEDRVSEARIADGHAATSQLLDLLWPAIEAVAAAIEGGDGNVGAADFRRALNAAMPAEQRAAAVQKIEFIRRPYDAP
jgi:hypothetical protein